MTARIDAARWSELRAAFDDLVELDVAVRSHRLAQIAAHDPEKAAILDSLLAADQVAEARLAGLDTAFGLAPEGHDRNTGVGDPLQLVGRMVAHFHIIETLGTGGMGIVYRAVDTRLNRPVALKFPLPTQRLDPHAKERFLREARAAGVLEHPSLCGIHAVGESDEGELFIAMPFYEGETLKARIERDGPFPIAEVIRIARQIAQGLAAAHRAGIVHRDLKPANVMLCADGTVKILDFGLAKTSDITLTMTSRRLGTVAYMAPEQIRGEVVDARADLWSLGVLIFEMIVGSRPFRGDRDISIAQAILHDLPARAVALRPGIGALDDVIGGLLQKDAGRRHGSAEQVDAELAVIARGNDLPLAVRWARRSARIRERVASTPRQYLVAAAMLAILGLSLGGWLVGGRARGGPVLDRSIVVLPFESPAHQTGVEHLSIGLLDGLIDQLREVDDMRVSSRQTALGYRATGKSHRRIAAELNVATILQGTIERAGEQLHVTARLLNGATSAELWRADYLRSPTEILDIQEEIGRAVSQVLGARLTAEESSRIARRPTMNAQAYDLYLRGHEYELRIPTPEAQRAAETLYLQALQLDSTFALARARLAAIRIEIFANRFDEDPGLLERARLDAEQALRQQPDLPDAHSALGYYWNTRGNNERALAQYQLALRHDPNNAEIHGLMGWAYNALRRVPEALAALERSLALDPGDIRTAWALAGTYRALRRYDDAVKYENYVIDRAPDGYMHMLWKGFDYLLWQGTPDTLAAMLARVPREWNHQGVRTRAQITLARFRRRPADAIAALQEAREAEIDQYMSAALLRAQAYESSGDVAHARAQYEVAARAWEDSVRKHPGDRQMKVVLALAWAGLGRKAEADRATERAVAMAMQENPDVPDRFVMSTAAEVFTRTGNTARAVDVLDKLLAMPAGRYVSIATLRSDPLWNPLRSNARFQRLLARHSTI